MAHPAFGVAPLPTRRVLPPRTAMWPGMQISQFGVVSQGGVRLLVSASWSGSDRGALI